MKTRQAVLVRPGHFEVREADVEPGPGEVLVRMEATGLCMSELFSWRGPADQGEIVLGHEGYGTVVKAGPGTTGRLEGGDRVTGLPGRCFAEYFVAPEAETMKVRHDLDQKIMLGEPLYCIHNVVRAAHPEIGDSVAMVGCGPMGQWVIQGLASRTLQALVAVDIDDSKLAMAKKFGATHTINPKNGNAIEQMKEITHGRLCDVVVEGTGGEAGVKVAIDLLRYKRPRLVIMSGYKKPVTLDMHLLGTKAVELLGAHPGICKDKLDGIRRTETLINNGVFKVDPLVTHRFKLTELNEAFTALESHPAGYLKGVVVP